MLVSPHIYLLCLLIVICQVVVNGQDAIIEKIEKDCRCPEFDKMQSFEKLLDIGKSDNEIEIRFAKFDMGYNTYAIINYNQQKYSAVCYIAKQANHNRFVPKKPSSPYRRYVINNNRLDTVLNRLIQYDVTKWKDPGIKGSRVPDAGIIRIQYKVQQDTGSYKVQPPYVVLLDHPENEAYQNLSKIVKVFQVMINEAVIRDSRKKLRQKSSRAR